MSKTTSDALGASAAGNGADKGTSLAPTASSAVDVINNDSATPIVGLPRPTQKRLGDVKVDRYTINGILVPDEAGQMRIQTSIHPRPKNAREAHQAVNALCARLVETNLEIGKRDLAINSLIAQNSGLKDELTKLLWEKDQLNQVVSVLQNELDDLKL